MQMELTPVLVSVETKGTNTDTEENTPEFGSALIKSVKEYNLKDCAAACYLDPKENTWLISNHMYLKKEKGGGEVQLALKDSSNSDGYKVTCRLISDDEGNKAEEDPLPLLRYPKKDGEKEETYYVMPYYRKDSPSEHKDAANWVNGTGISIIDISYKDNIRTVTLIVLASGFSMEENEQMMQDLVRMHHRLLMPPETTVMHIGKRWETEVEEAERRLNKIENLLRRMERSPEMALTAVPAQTPFHKVKHMEPRTVIDHAMGKRRVKTVRYTESADIYEHRRIRTYLEDLKKDAKRCADMEDSERRERAGVYSAGDDAEISQWKSQYENLVSIIDRLFDEKEEKKEQKFLRIEMDVTGLPYGTLEYSEKEKQWQYKVPQSWDWDEDKGKNFPVPFSIDDMMYRTKSLWEFMLPANAGKGNQILFVWDCLREIRDGFQQSETVPDNKPKVEFWGRGVVEKIGETDPNKWGTTFPLLSLRFEEITEIWINKNRYRYNTFLEEQKDNLLKLRQQFTKEVVNCDENLFMHLGQEQKKSIRKTMWKKTEQQRWNRIEMRIEMLLNTSPILKNVPSETRKLHSTNLFRNHYDYHSIYGLMKKTLKKFGKMDLWEAGDPIPLHKAHHLYEVWCLVKMLMIFTQEYGFQIVKVNQEDKGPDTLENILAEYLSHGVSLSETTFELKKEKPDMTIHLDYDKTIHIDDLNLRPDYRLTIRHKDRDKDMVKSFCMDAKFRNYENQGENQWLDDLFSVAFYKYIHKLEEKSVTINGSYILHSDSQNHQRYFGTDAKETLKKFISAENGFCKALIKREHEFEGELYNKENEKKLNDIAEQVKDCQVGSVCFKPLFRAEDTTDGQISPFRQLIQMIMEHHCKIYKEICWNCGSDVTYTEAFTRTGNSKFHVTCTNEECGERWIETHCNERTCHRSLGKHLVNYYKEWKDNKWNVECPDCSSVLSGGDEEDAKRN